MQMRDFDAKEGRLKKGSNGDDDEGGIIFTVKSIAYWGRLAAAKWVGFSNYLLRAQPTF